MSPYFLSPNLHKPRKINTVCMERVCCTEWTTGQCSPLLPPSSEFCSLKISHAMLPPSLLMLQQSLLTTGNLSLRDEMHRVSAEIQHKVAHCLPLSPQMFLIESRRISAQQSRSLFYTYLRIHTETLASKVLNPAGMPRVLVDVRHEAAHNELPSLSLLRLAAQQALLWLQHYYWERQAGSLRDTQAHITSLIKVPPPPTNFSKSHAAVLCRTPLHARLEA